jgi:hypothetical protein
VYLVLWLTGKLKQTSSSSSFSSSFSTTGNAMRLATRQQRADTVIPQQYINREGKPETIPEFLPLGQDGDMAALD